MSNPFEQVFIGLWSLVEDHLDVANVVKTGNMIKLEKRGEWKKQVGVADMPEIILIPADGVINIQNSSSGSKVVRDYEWLISTGDMRVNSHIHKIEWFLFTAHINWSAKLGSLLYNGESFVKRVSLLTARTGFSDGERNRGIKGWSAVWRTQVEMHFTTSVLKAEATV